MAINKIKPLSFKHLKATNEAQQISDGNNLYIRVRSIDDGGAISFRFRYRFVRRQLPCPVGDNYLDRLTDM